MNHVVAPCRLGVRLVRSRPSPKSWNTPGIRTPTLAQPRSVPHDDCPLFEPRVRRSRAQLSAVAAAAGVFGVAAEAAAHEIRPAVLALKELEPGRFVVHWSPPISASGAAAQVEPRFPEQCSFDASGTPSLLDCGETGLLGTIGFDAPEGALDRVSIDIDWLEGARSLRTLGSESLELRVYGAGSGDTFARNVELSKDYVELGVEHIVGGPDHLLFVTGLLLFVRNVRRLLLTITAFTLAHSITLAAATLGWAALPIGPVEFCIALSILLLAVEAKQSKPTWTHRAPWAVAFAFGLLHGFGFASALSEVGLPPEHVPLALLMFNVGVELGQLFVVGVLALVWQLLRRSETLAARVETAVVYGLGGAAAYWTMDRAVQVYASWGL